MMFQSHVVFTSPFTPTVYLFALLVNQSKVCVKPIRNGGNAKVQGEKDKGNETERQRDRPHKHTHTLCWLPFGTAGIGRHNDAVLPVFNFLFDKLDDAGLGKEIVDGHVEEALNLRGMQVHGDDVVSARHSQHVGDELCRNRGAALVCARMSG